MFHYVHWLTSGGKLWTPAQTTILGWWDASDITTITESGGLVSQWNDKSGKGHHLTQGVGASQPSTGGDIGGLNAIVNPNTKNMVTSIFSANTMTSTGGDYSVLCVYDVDEVTGFSSGAGMIQLANGFADNWGEHRSSTSTNWSFGIFSSNAGIDPRTLNTAFIKNTAGIFCNSYDLTGAGNFYLCIDGTVRATGNSYTAAPTGEPLLKIFDGLSTGRETPGKIGEIIIYSGNDTTTIQKIEGYLAHKWGTSADLPSDHPYKSKAPTV